MVNHSVTIDHTPHFSRDELKCHCCGQCLMNDDFMYRFIEPARMVLNLPVFVDSGYRCPKHDAEIRGDGNHPTGKAIDLRFDDLGEMLLFLSLLIERGIRRFGFSFSGLWLHADNVMEHPHPAVWLYEPGVKAEPE